jgi:hypothetical protein
MTYRTIWPIEDVYYAFEFASVSEVADRCPTVIGTPTLSTIVYRLEVSSKTDHLNGFHRKFPARIRLRLDQDQEETLSPTIKI